MGDHKLSQSYIAHSKNDEGSYHLLSDHLRNVSNLSKQFGEQCGLAEEARLAGLWHDIGKLTDEFQRKLKAESKGYVPHKGMGALVAFQKNLADIAFAIDGHHGGLPKLEDIKNKPQSKMADSWLSQPKWIEVIEQLKTAQPDWFDVKSLQAPSITSPTAYDLRIRMLYSCLVDADWLDTEKHFDPTKSDHRKSFPTVIELANNFFSDQLQIMSRTDQTPLNQLRNSLYEQTVAAASNNPGIYRMTIPTGGGKTRTALGFAFRHAKQHRHRRVVIALPYTSILDQMGEEYRKIFGDDAFLEHHSGQLHHLDQDNETPSRDEYKHKLATENWDANLILTTTVQLFNSLFSNKPSSCRKLHRLANSIIVLDEVQTLPTKYLEPICDILFELVRSYGVTLLLSTATQPALDRVEKVKGWDELYRGDVIADPAEVYNHKTMVRVKYEIPKDNWSWDKVSAEMRTNERSMVIVNTKADAVELFKLVQEHDYEALHLSTHQCGLHRREVIAEVKQRLKDDRPCHLITTQVVEAGVDIDFPLVLRATGPLDRVVQAAGRCNREGKIDLGRMIVFTPEDNKMPPGDYKHGAGIFESLTADDKFNPNDPVTFESYFSDLFRNRELDYLEINNKRERLDFPKVADKFHLIEQGGIVSVVVGYGGNSNLWNDDSPAKKLVDDYRFKPVYSRRDLFRKLSPYTVSVYTNELNSLLNTGLIVLDEKLSIYYWLGEYDDNLGIANKTIGQTIL